MEHQKLLSVSTALDQMLSSLGRTGVERIPLEEAAGRVLAAPIRSNLDLPPFSNSSMDGFAVRPEDVASATRENPAELRVVGDIPAGSIPDGSLYPGQAMRITTGAPVPEGAEAVVPVEDTDAVENNSGGELPDSVFVFRAVAPGDYIRPRGQDLRAGDPAIPSGIRLRPQEMGMLATLGYSQVEVFRKPRVAVLSTGDELIPIDQTPLPGKIRESNSHTLAAQVRSCGGEVIRLGIVPDDLGILVSRLEEAAESGADLIVSTAGVSVGAYDYVRTAVETQGKLDFWRVRMRPGKPIAFGYFRTIPFVGLPGNPVSAFVGFEVFLRPAIHKLGGANWVREERQAALASDTKSDGRESYLRGVVRETASGFTIESAAHQGSGNLFSLVLANALYVIPEGVTYLPRGANVQFWPI
jgi:molybdopterin molybdotransferase